MSVLFGRIVTMRIRSRLALLIMLPLIGVCFFAARNAAGELATADAAADLRTQTELLELTVEVQRAVNDELDQAVGIAEANRFGLAPSSVAAALGFDLAATLETTAARSDQAVASLRDANRTGADWAIDADIEGLLAAWDAAAPVRQRILAGDAGVDEVAEIEATMRVAADTAVTAQLAYLLEEPLATGSDGIADLLRALDVSLELQSTNRDEVGALTGLVLPYDLDRVAAPQEAFWGQALLWDRQLADMRSFLSPGLTATLAEIEADPVWIEYAAFRDEMRRLPSTELVPASSFAEIVDRGGILFQAVLQRSIGLGALDEAVFDEITADALAIELDARDQLRRTLGVLVALVLATMILTVLILRSIVRPLAQLETRARRISEGDLTMTTQMAVGPRDLAEIEHALTTLTAGLNVVEMQATALADGALDASVLDWSAPGRLGESLQGSVDKLRQLTASLDHQATHDLLTGLPNRAALLQVLERTSTGSIGQRQSVLAIMLDLDGFKQTNDMLGHPIGDEVLQHAAKRLAERANGGILGRLGGDEFMVLHVGPLPAEPFALAQELIDALSAPFTTSAGTVWLSAGAGLVHSTRERWLSPAEILQRSDLALLEAKARGQGVTVEFDEDLNDAVLERSRLQGELRAALADDKLELFFQPIVRADGSAVAGVEALLRWFDARGLQIPPNLFIPAAEQSDLILMIDNWVIREACRTLARWERDPVMRDLSLSLNISGRHVASTELVEVVREALAASGARAHKLTIEVTETEVIPNLEGAITVFNELKDLGVGLAIDDFGTGFASVAHLRRIPFDRIKIDGSFVAKLGDHTDRSIAGMLVSLGQSLDLEVVAEGVETEDQRTWSEEIGCTHVQGYYFGVPTGEGEIQDMVADLDRRTISLS